MSDRQARYDASPKGKRRRKRYERTAARLDYRAKWMREYRKKKGRQPVQPADP